MLDQQNMMKAIEEHSERLDLLERTLAIEEKQKKRQMEFALMKHQEKEKNQNINLYEGASCSSLLDEEDAQRKKLLDNMVQNSTNSNGPIVKVLTNVQGN